MEDSRLRLVDWNGLMKVTQILVLGVALGAGLLAAVLVTQMSGAPAPMPAPVASMPTLAPPPPPPETVDVLVAQREIPTGKKIEAADLGWQSFPKSGIVEFYLTKTARANAVQDLTGTIARATFLQGEPIREQRLFKADRGFMSVILSPGMRAVAVEVKAVSTAGGFVLPNDRVDIILTRANPLKTPGSDSYQSDTILNNVRVLAIDQVVGDRAEPALTVKDTVTLELSPRQAEMVVQAQQLGVISLALRSVREGEPNVTEDPEQSGGSVKVVRSGITSTIAVRR